MSAILELATMTRDEVAACAESAVVIVPLGSIEQHGEHLPLHTDGFIAEALSRLAVGAADTEVPLVLAPLLPIGSSDHHLFACTISLSTDTYISVLRDICTSLVASGFRNVFFVNGHGGNDLAMRLVCNDIILSEKVTVGACSYWTLTSVIEGAPPAIIGHAGNYETSILMSLAPETVGTPGQTLGDEPALFDSAISQGVLVNTHGEWARIGGVTERADEATAELGDRIVEDRVAALASVFEKFAAITVEGTKR